MHLYQGDKGAVHLYLRQGRMLESVTYSGSVSWAVPSGSSDPSFHSSTSGISAESGKIGVDPVPEVFVSEDGHRHSPVSHAAFPKIEWNGFFLLFSFSLLPLHQASAHQLASLLRMMESLLSLVPAGS